MSVRKFMTAACLALFACVATPSKASADWLLTPFVGWNWGGTANFSDFPDFEDDFEQRANFGASFGYMGAGVLGWELDFGYAPNFFENTGGPSDFQFGDSNLTTFMGNVLLGIPVGGQTGPGFRPYGTAGVGIMKSRIDSARDLFRVDATDWGFNIGGGAMFFFSDNFGLRGDLRYFRSLQDNQPDDQFDVGFADFRFFRGTVGATIRW